MKLLAILAATAALVATAVAGVVDRTAELTRLETLPVQKYEFTDAPASKIVAAVAESAGIKCTFDPEFDATSTKWHFVMTASPGAMIRALESGKVARFELLDSGSWRVSGGDPAQVRSKRDYAIVHGDASRLAELSMDVAKLVAGKGSAIPRVEKMVIEVTATAEVHGWVKSYLADVDVETPKSSFAVKFSGVGAESTKSVVGADGRQVVVEHRVQPPVDAHRKQAAEILVTVTFVRNHVGQIEAIAKSRQTIGVGVGNTPVSHEQTVSAAVVGDVCVLKLPPVTITIERSPTKAENAAAR